MNKKQIFTFTLIGTLLFFLVCLFLIAGVFAVQRSTGGMMDRLVGEKVQNESSVPMYLFTHSAGAGTFEFVSEDEYLLTLTDVDQNVIYFTDRPVRQAGSVPLVRFLDGLGFESENPPNAAIIIENENGVEKTLILELVEPVFNQDENKLIFHVVLLRDESTGEIAEFGVEEKEIPSSFAKATLLIDGCAKKGEVYCGSQGRCLDPKKQQCGGIKVSWKNDKNKKCHGMKLEEALKIANAKESECLLDGRATILESSYRCDDAIGGWRFGIEAEFLGEESKCDPECMVVAKEAHKKHEGVARVKYVCDDKSDEKGDANGVCQEVEFKKNHHYQDVEKALINKYHHVLKKANENHTSYAHHYCVTTGMPFASDKHWATDCSGLGGFALADALPLHFKLLDDDRKIHSKADRPLASDFYNFIEKQPTYDKKSSKQCWMKVEKLEDAKQGDFLIVKYGTDNKESDNSTGHVMWIDELHNKTASHRKVTVIDSAKGGHGSDTRKEKNTYNCKGDDHFCGIGKGDMWFYVDKHGRPDVYKWHANITDYKRTDDHITIGRVLDCKSEK